MVEVRDQGLGVWLAEAVLDVVTVRLADQEGVPVTVGLGVTPEVGVCDWVPVEVIEAVRLMEPVRVEVPVAGALTVLD